MPRNTSVSLGDHFASFIDEQVGSGRYGSASDVIRAGLRPLEEEEAKLEHLRAEIARGEASGPGHRWDYGDWLADRQEAYQKRQSH